MSDVSIAWAYSLGVKDRLELEEGRLTRGHMRIDRCPFERGTLHAKLWRVGFAS